MEVESIDCSSSNPSSTAFLLCDLKQVSVSVSLSVKGSFSVTFSTGSLLELNELM